MKKKAKKQTKAPATRNKTTKRRTLTAKTKQSMSNESTPSQSQNSASRAAEIPTGAVHVTRTELVWPGKYNDDWWDDWWQALNRGTESVPGTHRLR
ncbi:MAG: hypothetical protein RLY70_3 [Planctomycetota bacterium]|jgi:hypothetical protein